VSWWFVLLCVYGLALMAGVAAHADGPERGFVRDWLVIGTALAVPAMAAWAVAS